jgi:hypothetical protein
MIFTHIFVVFVIVNDTAAPRVRIRLISPVVFVVNVVLVQKVAFGKASKRDYYFFEMNSGATAHVGVKMFPITAPPTTASTTSTNGGGMVVTTATTMTTPAPMTTSRMGGTVTPAPMTTSLMGGTLSSSSTASTASSLDLSPSTPMSVSGSSLAQQTSSMTATTASGSQMEPSTSTSTNATASVASPSDSVNNGALIGGIVGGIVALLLIGGLTAFLVMRSRRPKIDGSDEGNAMANRSAAPLSNYERIPTPTSNYNDRITASQGKDYDRLTSSEL